MADSFTELLDDMWASIIERYEFDILKKTINFDLKTIDNGYVNRIKLVFEGVTAWYFVENVGDERFSTRANDDKDDYLELASIDFYKKGIGQIKASSIEEDWVNQYYSNANFALEIWNALLLVEAKSIVINGKRYTLI